MTLLEAARQALPGVEWEDRTIAIARAWIAAHGKEIANV